MPTVTDPTRQNGSTLIEVLIGMTIIAFLTLSIAPLLVLGLQVAQVSDDMTAALHAGTRQMETLRTAEFDAPTLDPGGSLTESVEGYSVNALEGDEHLFLRWQIEQISAHMKRIKVLVGEHSTSFGRPREVLLDTYRTNLK